MYTIFYNDSYIYDPYENLECVTDVKLTANVNAAAYLDFTISPKHPLYNVVEERSGIVKVYYDNEKLFEGVVDSIEMDMYGYKAISCVSALDYLGDTCTRSYHTGSVESTDKSKGVKAPESIDQFFQWLIDQHNQHVQNSNKTFIVGVNQGASFSESNIIDVESTSHESTADAITNNLLDKYGGYLTLTYDGEQRVLNLYSDVHEMNAQIMDFGVNITDFTKTTTTEDQYTAVYPIGGTPENKDENDKNTYPPIDISSLPDGTTEQDADIVKAGDVIFSRSAVARYGYKEYYYSENNILDATNLLKAAIIALRKSMSPKVSIDVKAVDCALFMSGYHHLVVGEAVRVRSNPHKVDEYLMVSSIELDLQNPENTEYTLGTSYDTLTGQQSSYLRSLNSTINSAVDSVGALDKTSKETAKTAEEAKNTANTAKDTANTAKSTADTANTTANTAKNTADKAQTAASEATKTATAAKATADSANKAAEDLKKKTAEIDKQVDAAQKAADSAAADAANAAANADKVRSDLQAEMDANQKTTESAIAAVDAKADEVRSDLTQQVQNVKSEMDTAVSAAQTSADKALSAADAAQKAADKANASTADLDKSIQAVDAKAVAAKQAAAEAQSKAENVASDLDSANAVIEQHTTELGTLTTKVSNAVTKADSALSVSTEAKQTATEASTTATSAYKDSQTALTQSTTATQTATAAKTTAESASKTATDSLKQSSSAVQTANQISTTLKTEYQTKADADKIYATQSSLKQTSDSITASVSKTYATKDALTALQNVADNAIESWRGTGVPTLTNKPASDWTTDAEKKKHSGDLYYDKATGKAYRFGSDDGKTYTWELNQDSDVTKALSDASNAQTSANNAQTTANAANSAASKAQTTANTAVSNAATAKNAADAAQSSANKAQGDVDKLKVDIPATYATKSSLTQTADSITANVEAVKTTANSAVTAASKAQQTADGISVNLTKNYQTKSQADAVYATQANLKATSESISAEVTKAQGTADGAVTAASKAQQTADAVTLNLSKNYSTKAQNDAVYATQTSLKATSDSLSANISANAKTAKSAVDKATSLEANLNGFKTTVSNTYTTKTEFNNLSIGGTNLCPKSNPYNSDMTNAKKDSDTGEITGTIPTTANTTWGAGVITDKYGMLKTPFDRQCIISFDVWSESAATIVVDVNNYPISGDSWNNNDNDGWRSGLQPTTTTTSGDSPLRYSVPANQWIRLWFSYKNTNSKNTNKVDLRDSSHIGFLPLSKAYSVKFNNFKFELGSRPTEYSVSSLDLQPAGDYATNSSLTQTANSIKAQVTEVSKTATGAMNKATTVEQTASGLSTKITEQAKTLAATTTTANEAKSTADSNKQTISQVKSTADGAVTRVSSLEQNLDGFKSTVSKTYQTKEGMSAYATTSALKQTSDSITAEVSKVSQTATGALNKATSVEQTANGLSTKITEQGKKLDTTTNTANQAKSTADSNKTTISQTANLVNAALAGDNMITDGGFESTEWWKGLPAPFHLSYGALYHGNHVLVGDAATGDNRCPLTHAKGNASTATPITVTKGRTYRLSGYYAWHGSVPSDFNASIEKLRLAKPDGTYIADAQTTKTTAWSYTYVDWKCPADGSITSVRIDVMHQTKGVIMWDDVAFRDITEAAETSNRVSSVEQNLNGFKTTVSKTYQTKEGMSNYATTSQLTQTASNIKSEVSQTYTTKTDIENLKKLTELTYTLTGTAGKVKWVKLGTLVSNGDSSSVLIHVYTGNGYNALAEQNSEFEIYIKDAWQSSGSATKAFGVAVTKVRLADYVKVKVLASNSATCDVWAYFPWTYWLGHYTIQGNYKSWTNHKSGEESDTEPTSGTAQNLAYDSLSTKSYVDQKSNEIALGVVKNYKGPDGSGLATKSDITASEKSITSTVSSTYATKSGVTKEIASKITQNNNSLNVKFATKTENQQAQTAANAANSNATDAQSRVGNLEDCISLTSNGVRTGKQFNGVYNGVSALVNTDGSFDLLDKDGNLLTRLNQHTFRVTGDNGIGSGYITLSQNGINITVQPTADTNKTYHIQIGSGGISLTSPDGTYMNCSASTGMALETKRYGTLIIGKNGLQLTNDQGWGLSLSANGWSMKWVGNHILATGPTAGKLYIDGHEIVTR